MKIIFSCFLFSLASAFAAEVPVSTTIICSNPYDHTALHVSYTLKQHDTVNIQGYFDYPVGGQLYEREFSGVGRESDDNLSFKSGMVEFEVTRKGSNLESVLEYQGQTFYLNCGPGPQPQVQCHGMNLPCRDGQGRLKCCPIIH